MALATSVAWAGDVLINETNFPDANFRAWALSQDFGADGVLTDAEVLDVTSMNVFKKGISSLKGLEHFSFLEVLNCADNKLQELDVSKNYYLKELRCDSNELTALDVSKQLDLRRLSCFKNHFKGAGLNVLVQSLPELPETEVGWFYLIWKTDDNTINTQQAAVAKAKGWKPRIYHEEFVFVGNMPTIEIGFVEYLGQDPDPVPFDHFYFADEAFYDAIYQTYVNLVTDGSWTAEERAHVLSLNVSGRGITRLDGVEYFTSLTDLDCSRNQLDRSAMESLVSFLPTVSNGRLRVINGADDQNVMTTAQAAAAKAKGWTPLINNSGSWQEYGGSEPAPEGIAIDAAHFPDENFRSYLLGQEYGADGYLTDFEIGRILDFYISEKEIASVQGIEFFPELRNLYCSHNPLTEIDASKNLKLTKINCQNCQIASLNVKGLAHLATLVCYDNQLTTLDVADCAALTAIECNQNQLTALDVSQNKQLTALTIYLNRIKGAAMDALIAGLPTVARGSLFAIWSVGEQNVVTTVQVAAAKTKGWIVYAHGYNGMEEYEGSSPAAVDVDINEVNFPDEAFRNFLLAQTYGADGILTAEEAKKITYLQVNGLGIQRLKGIEHFTAATTIYCYNNQISGANMTELVECLPVVSVGNLNVMNLSTEENVIDTDQVAAAKAKGWTPRKMQRNGSWNAYIGSEPVDNTPVVVTQEQVGNLGFWGWVWTLECGADGQLTEREISKVTRMNVSNRYFQDLNGIEYFTALTELICYNNLLSTLDLSKNTALTKLECYDNRINGEGAYAFVRDLPTVTDGIIQFTMGSSDKNSMTPALVAVAKAKGWTVQYFDTDLWDWNDYAGIVDGIGGIADGQLTKDNAGVYDPSGRQLPQPRRGVNILRSADGTTQKVIVK